MNDFIRVNDGELIPRPHAGQKYVRIYLGQSEFSDIILRGGSWSLQKRLGSETFSFTLIQYPNGIRPMMNGQVVAYHGDDLLFGGLIKSATQSRFGGEVVNTFGWNVECRGFEILAEQIILTGRVAKGPLYTVVYNQLYLPYLMPKGVGWNDPTSGGPMMQTDVEFVRSKLADILSQIGKQVNAVWRINGEKIMGVVLPGTLPMPVYPLTGEHLLLGSVNVKEIAYEFASRLILQTGGTGDADHTETHIGDSAKTHFLLNVEPKIPTKKTENDVDTWTYYWPTEVYVNGIKFLLDGSTVWRYDSNMHAVYTTDADNPPPSGYTIKVNYKISFPATVRVWLPQCVESWGKWYYPQIYDKLINLGHIPDVSQAKAWGDVELQRRAVLPVVLTGNTRWKGFYPLQNTHVDIPDMFIWDNFLLQSVNVTDEGLDTIHHDHSLTYQLEMIQGGTIGRQYEDLFKEFMGGGAGGGTVITGSGGQAGSSGGIGGGGTEPPPSGATSLPTGFTFHLGGENDVAYDCSATGKDIPEMIPTKFGGTGMAGQWTFKAFGYRVTGTGPINVTIDFAGTSELAVAVIDQMGVLLQGPFGVGVATLTAPPTVGDLRIVFSGNPGTVIIGHCVLQKD